MIVVHVQPVIAIGTAAAALIVAIVSLAASAASILVSVILWRRSGARVEVTAAPAFMVIGRQFDADTEYVAITAANTGRAPVTVDGWGIQLPEPNGDLVQLSGGPNQPVPHRLEPGAAVTWYIDAAVIRQRLADLGIAESATRAFVKLATGKKVLSKKAALASA